jgi:hypothetical protein
VPTLTNKKCFLAAGQATATGENELLSVGSGLVIIAARIQGLATFTRLDGADSSLFQVSKELTRSEWIYFACHGIPDRKLTLHLDSTTAGLLRNGSWDAS